MVSFVFTWPCQGQGECVWLCQAKPLERAVVGCETPLTRYQSLRESLTLTACALLWLQSHYTVPCCPGLEVHSQSVEPAVRTRAKPVWTSSRCISAAWEAASTLTLRPMFTAQWAQHREEGCRPHTLSWWQQVGSWVRDQVTFTWSNSNLLLATGGFSQDREILKV